MSDFHFKEELLRYTTRLVAEIRSPRRRSAVRREYAEHIEDAVYERMLSGEEEAKAFRGACEELGDVSKIAALLGAVHNKDRMPSFVRPLIAASVAGALGLSYLFIQNTVYRTWLVFLLQIAILVASVFLLLLIIRIIACLRIRISAVRRLKKYARDNGLVLSKNANCYRSVFRAGTVPEITVETETRSYHLAFFPTFWRKKHLRLFDNGLYTYSSYVGYVMLYTRAFEITGVGALVGKQGIKYFPLLHSDMTEVPKGMHLMPKTDWESFERAEKENVRILLLNPIPLNVSGIEGGALRKLGDGTAFGGYVVYSMTGFISYLKGERIDQKR